MNLKGYLHLSIDLSKQIQQLYPMEVDLFPLKICTFFINNILKLFTYFHFCLYITFFIFYFILWILLIDLWLCSNFIMFEAEKLLLICILNLLFRIIVTILFFQTSLFNLFFSFFFQPSFRIKIILMKLLYQFFFNCQELLFLFLLLIL